jgi:hypothetical protein
LNRDTPSWRIIKIWEGDAPFMVFQMSVFPSAYKKLFLSIDAQQKQAGVRLDIEKPQGLKPQGALVNMMRKHCRAARVSGIFKDHDGSLWMPLFHGSSAERDGADFYLLLSMDAPPEIRFMTGDATVLMRRSSAGTFTKRRRLKELTPTLKNWPPDFLAMQDLTKILLPGLAPGKSESTGELAENHSTALEASTSSDLLPAYQRSARDKVARRLKTLKKAVEKTRSGLASQAAINTAQQEAALLKSYMHLATEGADALTLEPAQTGSVALSISLNPERTLGQNLEDKYIAIKKLKKNLAVGSLRLSASEAELQDLEETLKRLRSAALSQPATDELLARAKLSVQISTTPKKDKVPQAKPYKIYMLGTPPTITCFVGKGSHENDELTKAAKANDIWLHAAGVTGSHVIIPAKSLRSGAGNIVSLWCETEFRTRDVSRAKQGISTDQALSAEILPRFARQDTSRGGLGPPPLWW